MQKITFKDKAQLEIVYDDDPESPREWSNIGRMICFHKRYNLGDDHDYRFGDFESWDELQDQIEKDLDVAEILPLFLMDHSGISISVSPFGCPWDSGKIGFILCTKEDAKTNFGSSNNPDRVRKCLISEVETYDQYLRGEIYRFVLRSPPCEKCGHQGEVTDSCGGFYGDDILTNGMMDNLPEQYRKEIRTLMEKGKCQHEV